jgi:hypothetical protein
LLRFIIKMVDLTTKICTGKESQDKILIVAKKEKRKFFTRYLTITGELEVKVPGRPSYENVASCSVCYKTPIEFDLDGRVADLETEKGKGLIVENARVHLTAYRENKTESELGRSDGEINLKRLPDPEVTLSQNNKTIVLNQVIGIPVVYIKKGMINYNPKTK